MSSYRIELRDRADGLVDVRTARFALDDQAIDYAGGLDHPHGMKIWDGERLVAEFPPVGRVADAFLAVDA